jgi:protein-S-isoprenylcysteine O-methyltransferase Ste14
MKTFLILKTLLFTLLIPGAVVLLLPYWLVGRPRTMPLLFSQWHSDLSALFFGFGFLLYLICSWLFIQSHGTPAPIDPPKQLVATGPYRLGRNPMYVAVLCILVSETLYFESWILALYALMVFFGFHLWILFYEEPILKKQFGSAYLNYCRKVHRWFPWPGTNKKKRGKNDIFT